MKAKVQRRREGQPFRMKRAQVLQEEVDKIAREFVGISLTEAHEQSRCVLCGKSVDEEQFRDALSKKEYGISGTCQECQDSVFGEDE